MLKPDLHLHGDKAGLGFFLRQFEPITKQTTAMDDIEEVKSDSTEPSRKRARPPPNPDMKHICFQFYTLEKESTDKKSGDYVCKCGKGKRTLEYGTGYSNLMQHIQNNHENELNELQKARKGGGNQLTLDHLVSPKASNIYAWMRVVIDGNHAFSIVEDSVLREYMKLSPISRNTLMEYLERTYEATKTVIRCNLPPRFGLMFDGWDHNDRHYTAVFCCSPCGNFLLGIRTMPDEEHLDADQHIELFKQILGFVCLWFLSFSFFCFALN